MSMSFADVDEILRVIDQFPAAEIRFEHGDLKLYVKRTDLAGGASKQSTLASMGAPAQAAAPTQSTQLAAVAEATAAHAAPAGARHSAETPNKDRSGQLAIESPLMGVYYAAPAPDADPFVKVGQSVQKGEDLCIIEVMKVMNLIKAPRPGVVVEIAAENGAMVEMGQALLWIRPTDHDA